MNLWRTCVSFNCNVLAISMRRARVKYRLKWNSFSNSVSCLLVKLVRPELFVAAKPQDICTILLGLWLPESSTEGLPCPTIWWVANTPPAVVLLRHITSNVACPFIWWKSCKVAGSFGAATTRQDQTQYNAVIRQVC